MKISSPISSRFGVAIAVFAGLLVLGCTGMSSYSGLLGTFDSGYAAPRIVGKIEAPEIKESSGLAASECQDVLWTHNDAGNAPLVFAMDLQGRHLGAWQVTGAENVDWESIAASKSPDGKCSLVIADIGDNDEQRKELTIYRIPEPTPNGETAASTAKSPLQTPQAETLKFTYPQGPRNAETVLVHPQTSHIYVVTKNKTGPAEVHKLRPEFGRSVKSELVAQLSMPSTPTGLLTGGSMSPDGKRVMLCDVKNGYELVLPDGSSDPDLIWKQKPVVVDLGTRKQGEGVSYGRDGVTLYASSEKKNTPLIQIRRK